MDKNFLERPELEAFLANNQRNRVLLHDFSVIEALAGNALKNTTLAMAVACKYPEQVMVLKNSSKLLAYPHYSPLCRRSAFDPKQTSFVTARVVHADSRDTSSSARRHRTSTTTTGSHPMPVLASYGRTIADRVADITLGIRQGTPQEALIICENASRNTQ